MSQSSQSGTPSEYSDDFIRDYLKKSFPSYPDYWTNIDLGKKILKNCNTKTQTPKKISLSTDGFERKLISECNADQKVEIEGVITEVFDTRDYIGCSVCRRKKCDQHQETPLKIYVNKFKLTGVDGYEIEVTHFSTTEFVKPALMDSVRINGMTKIYESKITLVTQKEPIIINKFGTEKTVEKSKENINTIVSELKKVGSMRKKIFDGELDMYGIKFEDVDNLVEVINKENGVQIVVLRDGNDGE